MAILEFDKPEGCVAEGHYTIINTQYFSGNERTATSEFSAVCALRLGPFHDASGYNSGAYDRGEQRLAEFKDRCADELGRLIVPFCAACPNNPLNKTEETNGG